MSELEVVITDILKKLNIDMNSGIYIMLQLKGKEKEQKLFLEYLKTINPKTVTRTQLLNKVTEIIKNK